MQRAARAETAPTPDNYGPEQEIEERYLSAVPDETPDDLSAQSLETGAADAASVDAEITLAASEPSEQDENEGEDEEPAADASDDGQLVGVVRNTAEDEDSEEYWAKKAAEASMVLTTDGVRAYLKQIGKVKLLAAHQEVDLAKRREAGLFAGMVLGLATAKTEAERLDIKQSLKRRNQKGEVIDGPAEDRAAEKYMARFDDRVAAAKASPQMRRDLRMIESDGKAATEHLTVANLRLVVSIAKRYAGHGLEFLDLIQEGNAGLIRAVQKFDYTRSYKFSTYATWWIRQAVTRARADQGSTIRIPVHRAEEHRRIDRATRELQNEGIEVTPENIAERMSDDEKTVTPERVLDLQEDARTVASLDQKVGDGEDTSFGDFFADPNAEDGAVRIEEGLRNKDIRMVLRTLGEREAGVVVMRFGLDGKQPRTLEEIAEVYGVTRERIRQIENKTMQKLRHPSRAQYLGGWLDPEAGINTKDDATEDALAATW